MSANPQELRVVSDTVLRDLEALVTLEEQKRQLPMDDPGLTDLAAQIQTIASRVLEGTDQQLSLAKTMAAHPSQPSSTSSAGSPGTPSIEETRRSPASILAEWRDLERRAAGSEPGSPERMEIEVLASKLREEYRAAVTQANRKD
jgi:hypothetical protein